MACLIALLRASVTHYTPLPNAYHVQAVRCAKHFKYSKSTRNIQNIQNINSERSELTHLRVRGMQSSASTVACFSCSFCTSCLFCAGCTWLNSLTPGVIFSTSSSEGGRTYVRVIDTAAELVKVVVEEFKKWTSRLGLMITPGVILSSSSSSEGGRT